METNEKRTINNNNTKDRGETRNKNHATNNLFRDLISKQASINKNAFADRNPESTAEIKMILTVDYLRNLIDSVPVGTKLKMNESYLDQYQRSSQDPQVYTKKTVVAEIIYKNVHNYWVSLNVRLNGRQITERISMDGLTLYKNIMNGRVQLVSIPAN